jgi:hypothetical protein
MMVVHLPSSLAGTEALAFVTRSVTSFTTRLAAVLAVRRITTLCRAQTYSTMLHVLISKYFDNTCNNNDDDDDDDDNDDDDNLLINITCQ